MFKRDAASLKLKFDNEARIKFGKDCYLLSTLLDVSMLNTSRQQKAQESAIVQNSPITVQKAPTVYRAQTQATQRS